MSRLNKYLSDAGVCSRREADRLIESGRVTVDGKRAVPGMKVEPSQEVRIGKKLVGGRRERIVLAVNKPVGIICTEERRERKSIVRFLNYPERITYAGRLDKDSEGLLLMTNDGDLINGMMRARYGHEKEYKVTVDKPVTEEFLRQMEKGVRIRDPEKGLKALQDGNGGKVYLFHCADPRTEPADTQDVRVAGLPGEAAYPDSGHEY